jgi:Ca2+-transporting ATPase
MVIAGLLLDHGFTGVKIFNFEDRKPMERWWQLDVDAVISSLNSDSAAGLSANDAAERLRKYGPNQLVEKKGPSPLTIFLSQFNDFVIWVLIGAALVSGFLQEWIDTLAIIAIVILNAILGFVQEYRAEKSLAALKKLSSPMCKVIRDGEHGVIASAQLVPGDIVELESGDNVPADGRVIWHTSNFAVQEASLTGESTPVAKTVEPLSEADTPLADRANMVYMGTSVACGKAKAIIAETGMQTELGRIAGMVQEIEREATPLQRKLEQFGKWIVYLCFILVGLIFAMNVLRSDEVMALLREGRILDVLRSKQINEAFLTSVSLAVAAIPEGLPAVVTIALALGVQRMVKRHALVRKLQSVETLGCATVICSDKTGTLTKNEMTVQAIFAGEKLFRVAGIGYAPKGEYLLDGRSVDPWDYPELSKTLEAGVLCNGATLVEEMGSYRIVGDPTEGAILTAAAKAGLWKDKKEADLPFVDEIPFDSERKKMTIIRRDSKRTIAFVKGAPDVLLADCTKVEIGNAGKPLDAGRRLRILTVNNDLANQAMRVLAVAYRVLDGSIRDYKPEIIEKDLVFVGLIAMIDPPREEVKQAMQECATAGIKTVMITGDHKNTAVAIAKQLGFFRSDSLALSGEELDKLSDADLRQVVERTPVYARVSPEHKLKIVRAWRARKEIVAMTGDGVNDAPAVKEADIGVAMGITGTDVTKEVSDMVITDDNFASIVSAVEEGRGIYDNIKKFVHYLLSCNAGEILVMFVSSLIGLPVPLLPIHILWINLVTDGLPALALGVDPVAPHIMNRPPRPSDEPVVTKRGAFLMLAQGAIIAFCSLLAFALVLYVEEESLVRARTAAFVVLACSQLFHAFNCRSMTESLFRIGVFTNKSLVLATGFSFLLQMSVVYLPFLQRVFKTEPLGLFDWLLVVLISSFPLWAMELFKGVRKMRSAEKSC